MTARARQVPDDGALVEIDKARLYAALRSIAALGGVSAATTALNDALRRLVRERRDEGWIA